MHLIKTIPLPNALEIEIWDASRPIAAYTVRIELVIKISVEVKREYFENPEQYEMTRKAFGSDALFEYRKERSFVPLEMKQAAFDELLSEFMRNSLEYLSKPNFPSRFILSKYRELQNIPTHFSGTE